MPPVSNVHLKLLPVSDSALWFAQAVWHNSRKSQLGSTNEVEFITHELQILGLGTLYGLGPVSMTGCLVTKSNSTTSLVECGLEMSHVTSDVNLEVEITSPYFESTFSMSLEYPRVEIGLDFWVSSAGDVTIKSLDLDKRPKVLSKTKRVPSILKVFIPRLYIEFYSPSRSDKDSHIQAMTQLKIRVTIEEGKKFVCARILFYLDSNSNQSESSTSGSISSNSSDCSRRSHRPRRGLGNYIRRKIDDLLTNFYLRVVFVIPLSQMIRMVTLRKYIAKMLFWAPSRVSDAPENAGNPPKQKYMELICDFLSLGSHNLKAYDTTASISSDKKEVQGTIAEYHGCVLQSLNIVICHACKIKSIQNMMDSCRELYSLFEDSPKRPKRQRAKNETHYELCAVIPTVSVTIMSSESMTELANILQQKWDHVFPVSSAFETRKLSDSSPACVRRIRTWKRSTMTTERLSDFSLIAMHSHFICITRGQLSDFSAEDYLTEPEESV
ncbi:hypothetical protein GQR58_004767 [Nymphon striatum]|nr:hypothetical protein GQR58_004767 [Nymphon striatum]